MTAIEQVITTELTSGEQQLFEQHEEIIERGLQTFYAVGYALADIRDQRLYRAEYKTFEDYCQQRWNMSKSNANRLVQAASIVDNLAPIGVKPQNEAQVRPLAKLETAEDQQDAWKEAVERSNGKPTAKVVGEVVQERTNPPAAETERFKTGDLVIHQGNYHLYKIGHWIAASNEYEIVSLSGNGQVLRSVPASMLARATDEQLRQRGYDESAVDNDAPPDAQQWAESVLGVSPGPALEQQASATSQSPVGLQSDFTYVMSEAEKRLCGKIGDQYGCTVRQFADSQGRGNELWEATREGIVIATTNTLKNLPTYIEQAIAWKAEHEQQMSARGYHLITLLKDGSIRFAAELPRTAGFQTVDLPLIKIAAILRRVPMHQRALDTYYALLERDSTLVGAASLNNPATLYAWLEEQGYQWDAVTWTKTIAAAPALELVLPDGWELRTFEDGTVEAYYENLLFSRTHPTEDAAIREAMTMQELHDRLQQLGFEARCLHGEWHLRLVFTGSNANGELEEFLYLLEWE
jgi:hypothetical protein